MFKFIQMLLMFIVIVGIYSYVTGEIPYFYSFIFIALFIIVFLLSRTQMKQLVFKESRFYFDKEKEVSFSYKYIKEIVFDGENSSHLDERHPKKYSMKLMIHYQSPDMKRTRIFVLDEETYGSEFWEIISAIKQFSESNRTQIKFDSLIPSNENDFKYYLEGWRNQEKWAIELFEHHAIQQYAELNQISFERATKEVKKLQWKVIAVFFLIVFVFLIVGTLKNASIQISANFASLLLI